MKKRDKNKHLKFGEHPTTNSAPDTHKKFCERCLAHNGRCVNKTGMKGCSV